MIKHKPQIKSSLAITHHSDSVEYRLNQANSQQICRLFWQLFCGFWLLISATALSAETNTNSEDTNRKLNKIQQQINQQKSLLTKTKLKISDLEKQLKKDDIALGKIASKVAITQKNIAELNAKSAQLSKQIKQLNQQKKQQETALATQLRSAYSAGHHDYIKLILNQKDPAIVQRTITQYQYLNKARIKQIENFKSTINELQQLTINYQEKLTQLQQLKTKQTQQQQIFKLSKVKQQQTLTALNKRKLSSQEKINKLKAQENAIVKLLKQMAIAAQKQVNSQAKGLSKLKRKLSWPVKGKIKHSFGTRKQGYLKWKGVFLSAPLGKQVQTIHSGTVLFSDWLKGYGLVTVIDHGDGYMSLYGHNQALLKSVGDRVEAGEPIALVGQSGGQINPGLYFEIRHSGKAVNPKLWCR